MTANLDPTSIANDPSCPDTGADASNGALGLLASFLRQLFYRFFPPWVTPPPGSQFFDYQATVATNAIGTTAVVLAIKVPTGMRFVGRRLSCNIIGPGFVQGSGSLIWSVQANDAPIRGYAQILNEFGSPQIARPTDGILAESDQLVTIKVTNVGYAAAGTNVNASLAGWMYPVRSKRKQ